MSLMRRAPLMMTCVLLALSIACVLAGLGRLPALTLDEAWTGRFATWLTSMGFYTPHEMNTYTGPLYGLLLSRVMSAWGVSVAVLRLPGALANALAFLLAAWELRRRAGPEAAAWWALLLAAGTYLLFKSRLAWEVYALQPLLLTLTLMLLDRKLTWLRALLFMAVTLVGVQNHFIYLSVPVSLVILFAVRAAWRGEDDLGPSLRLCLTALAAGAVVFLVKPRLSEAAWASQKPWAVPLFFALIPLAATAAVAGAWERRLVALLSHPGARRWGLRLLGLGLFAFFVWHLPPLWEILAGPVVWKRMIAWNAPWWLDLPLHLWSLFLLAVLGWNALRAWHGHERLSAGERTLALWPWAYMACFSLFRNTSSLRYYCLIQFLSLLSLAAALARLPKPDRRPVAITAALAMIVVQAVFWRELASPQDRRPLQFRVGWRSENSWDFARKDTLFAAFDASNACGVVRKERGFVPLPLIPVLFHQKTRAQTGCDDGILFDADDCRDCATPPFKRWEVLKR